MSVANFLGVHASGSFKVLSPKQKKAMELALPVSKGCCALRVNFKVFGQDWLGSRLLSFVLFLS
jgi:hypothetical protein